MLSLSKRSEFNFVFKKGRIAGAKVISVRSAPNKLNVTRCSFMITKKVGIAVVRNTVRRRLREIIRSLPLKEGVDVIMLARPEAAGLSFQELKEDVELACERARLLEKVTDA